MSSTLIRISALVVLFTISCTFLVNAAPQLFEDEQELVEANNGPFTEPLTRTRRGSQHQHYPPQPQGSYGHHQPSYSPPSYSAGGLGGGASQGYGQSSGGGGGGGGGHGGPVGPVFTFVRTDYHGNFQTGVRHKVGGGWGWKG